MADPGVLDEAYFDVMAASAPSHWWYRNRRHLVGQLCEGRGDGPAIDVGCGTGEMVDTLVAGGYRPVYGSDLDSYVLPIAARGRTVFQADARNLPVTTSSFRCVVSTDVLEHVEDEAAAAAEWARLLRPGGTLVVTVPAYQWMFSDHDRWACHHRRYSARRLRNVLEAAGFHVERTTYFNASLVLPGLVLRKTPLRRLVRNTDEAASGGGVAGVVLGALAAVERRLIRHRVRIPFGLSVLAVATLRQHAVS